MPLPPVTRFSAVATKSSPTNNNNGLYVLTLTPAQIAAIPANTKINGGLWYNTNTNNLEAVINNTVEVIQYVPSEGFVTGPPISVANNIVIFKDTTGQVIADSGVDIAQVAPPAPLLRFSNSLETLSTTVNEIGNLGHIKFTSGLGLIFVDGLMPVEFITNTFKSNTDVCSLFTGGLPSSSTSPSALVELQSDTGALLLSRMTTTERDALSAPSGANGMLLFNTTSGTFNGFDGTNWRVMPLLNTDGTLTAADPLSSANLATKNYVDTAIAVPAAAKFIIQTANASVPNAQVLGSLVTGLLKNTTTTGVLTIGIAGTDYYSPGNPTRILNSSNNFFIGTNAGNTTLTGVNNLGVGDNALSALTTGTNNLAIGLNTLMVNATGTDNLAIGTSALKNNTTGVQNVAIGEGTLKTNTTGLNNLSIGYNSMGLNTTGSNNTAVGSQALSNNITGTDNCAFGYQALLNNTNGTPNDAFGYQTLFNNTSGTRNSAFSYQALSSNTIGSNNAAFGYQALQVNLGGSQNVAIGMQALKANTSGNNNLAVGAFALQSTVASNFNSAFGNLALNAATQTTGSNDAFGYSSMQANTTGYSNAAFGYFSLFSNITGIQNTAVGNQAGFTYNNNNNCVFLGYQADSSVNTLTNAVAIGYQAFVGASNCMVLGGSGSIQLSVGIGLTPNAQLQLPTIHANRKLVLYETANNDHQVFGFGTASGIFRYQIDSTNSNYIWNAAASSSSSNELMRLTGNGQLLIGSSGAVAQVYIFGGVQNVVSEETCLRVAASTTNVAKIELNSGNLWELRADNTSFGIYLRTGASAGSKVTIDPNGVFYTQQSFVGYAIIGSADTTVTAINTPIKANWPSTTTLNNSTSNFTVASSRCTYTGTVPINAQITFIVTATTSTGTGEVTTFLIYKNGTTKIAQISDLLYTTNKTEGSMTVSTISPTVNTDYYELWVKQGTTIRTITITNLCCNISST